MQRELKIWNLPKFIRSIDIRARMHHRGVKDERQIENSEQKRERGRDTRQIHRLCQIMFEYRSKPFFRFHFSHLCLCLRDRLMKCKCGATVTSRRQLITTNNHDRPRQRRFSNVAHCVRAVRGRKRDAIMGTSCRKLSHYRNKK